MENSGYVFVLAAVLVVGVVGAIGLTTTQSTGAALTSQPGCYCEISQISYTGQPLGQKTLQFIATPAGVYQSSDAWCQNRCEIMFQRGHTNVVGYVAPFGAIRPPVV